MNFPAACPEIPVRDLAAGLAYYRDKLGFTVDWSNEELGLAGLSRGASRLFMSAVSFRALGRPESGPITLWLNAENRDHVDAIHAEWLEAGAVLSGGPRAEDWKLYEFSARDPDDNVWRVFYDFAWEEVANEN